MHYNISFEPPLKGGSIVNNSAFARSVLRVTHFRCVVVTIVIVVVVESPVVAPVVVSENPWILSVNSQTRRVAFFKFFTDKVFIV